MYSKTYGMTLFGIDAHIVGVETDVGGGLPCFEMSGYLNTEVKEAKERVKISIKNSGYDIPPQRIIINFMPANLRKNGTGLDVAVAIGILKSNGIIKGCVNNGIFIGELGFDGSIRAVDGVLAFVLKAKELNFEYVIVPSGNGPECVYVDGIDVFEADKLKDVVDFLNDIKKLNPADYKISDNYSYTDVDFSDIHGQYMAKRAALISACGMHNLLLIGSPGSGKSMIAKRIPGILPKLSVYEMTEITKIYSTAGLLRNKTLINRRPFRTPHTNLTEAALVGGGSTPKPGELTLASKGVLFLDELTRFKTNVLEALRQPLEDRVVTVSRNKYTVQYPADCMLVAAMNPCKCGYYPDRHKCQCTDIDIDRYIGKISKPIFDRFDISVRTETVTYDDMNNKDKDNLYSTNSMREQVERVRIIQKERFIDEKINFNSEMSNGNIDRFCKLGSCEGELMREIFSKFNLTARGYVKILKVARTIADLDNKERIDINHISEAAGFRNIYEHR